MEDGRIIKALSGFYYVQSIEEPNEIYACRGRGVFRKRKINPLVGDYVKFDRTNPQEGYVTEIKSRKNEFTRPPISNIDQAVIVNSALMPTFSPLLLDRFLIIFEAKKVKPIIFITKMDLVSSEEKIEIDRYKSDYEQIGYDVELIISKEGSSIPQINHYFDNNTTVITGQSGVGKSSILNALNPLLLIETDEISQSLGRGKHTTRHVELVAVNKGLVGDTPGFSSIESTDIEPEELGDCFPEMLMRKDDCRFRGCMHHKEPNCAVKVAVEQGEILDYRYANYLVFLEEIQSRKVRY